MLKLLSSEDAVSEVVDYVTILGILVISIGIIGVAGYPMVKNAQNANYIENTKQSFIVLGENINKVVLGQAPSQNVELKLYGGTLSANGSSTITINLTNSSGGTETFYQQMRSIESTIGDTVIAYEGTGVWVKYPNGNTVLVSKPRITNQNNVLVIPVVYVGGTSSIGGSGMSRIVADGVPAIIFYKNVSNINVTINSTYWNGWKKYFEDTSLGHCNTLSSSSGNCTVNLATNADVYILNIQLNTKIT